MRTNVRIHRYPFSPSRHSGRRVSVDGQTTLHTRQMIDTLGIHTAPDKMFAFVDANAADEMRKKVESCLASSSSDSII